MKNYTTAGIIKGSALMIASLAIISIPSLAFAETYNYVNTSGTIQKVTADSAQIALATAPNLAVHSGVAFDMGILQTGDTTTATNQSNNGMNQYHYINTSGIVQTVFANNATEAYSKAVNIDPQSGMALDKGILETGDSVTGE